MQWISKTPSSSSFIVDPDFVSLWGFYLGRPVRMNMEDVTVEKPGSNLSDSHYGRWVPYGLPGFLRVDLDLIDPTELVSQQRVLLCEIMAPLGHIL
jgi:hypothetical protein